jgi:photosystem II stability/assembly factor-like uncharacterized protein
MYKSYLRHLFSLILLTILTFSLQAQFVEQPWFTRATLEDVHFLDINKGFIVGDSGIIAMTTDAGVNWNIVEKGNTRWFREIHFFDAQNGIAVGDEVFLSSDGGLNWTNAQVPLQTVYDFDALDTNNCFISGNDNQLLKSADKGVNWQLITDSTTNNLELFRFSFADAAKGFAYQGGYTFHQTTYFTLDSGKTWQERPGVIEDGGNIIMEEVEFITDQIGFRTGLFNNQFRITTDGGHNWKESDQIAASSEIVDFFIDTTQLGASYACGRDMFISKALDFAGTWLFVGLSASSFRERFKGIYFINDTIGWVVGERGRFAKTTNAGGRWYVNQVETYVEHLDLSVYPNPTEGLLYVRSELDLSTTQIHLINMAGQIFPLENKDNTLDLQVFSPGLYLLVIEHGEGFFQENLIIR